MTEFLQNKIPEIYPVVSDATYLMWLDCRKLTEDSRKFTDFIREKTGLFVMRGSVYGKNGEGFLRLNIATSKLIVEDGMQRLLEGVTAWKNDIN